MRMPQFRRGVLPGGSSCIVLLGLACAPLAGNAQPDPTRVQQVVADAVAATAAEQHIGVDPHLVSAMVASSNLFASNFCYASSPSVPDTRCAATLFNPSVLNANIRQFLADSISGASEVTVLGARLAQASGGDFAQAGWPSTAPNDVGVVTLGATGGAVQQVTLSTPSGQVQVGADVGRLLMQAGQYTLTVRLATGSETTSTILVRARQQVALSTAPAGHGAAVLGAIDVPPGRFCYERRPAQSVAPTANPLAEFNWGRSQLPGGPGAYLAPIATKYAVDIQVDDQVGECQGRCRQAMGVVFSQAIAVWRAGCQRCSRNALAVLQVGNNNVWIDSRLASRLRTIASGTPAALDLTTVYPDEMMRSVVAPSLNIPTMSVPSYEYVSSNQTLKDALCSQEPTAAPWLPAAQQFVCGTGADIGVIRPTVRLMGDSTHCGKSHDFLACGLPGAGIELGLGSTRFLLATPAGTIKIGHPEDVNDKPVDMLDVVLHEVGHWFGVPHPKDVGIVENGDIMASTLGDGQGCVSATSLTMMNNAMDTRWTWRVSGQQGLRKPH